MIVLSIKFDMALKERFHGATLNILDGCPSWTRQLLRSEGGERSPFSIILEEVEPTALVEVEITMKVTPPPRAGPV